LVPTFVIVYNSTNSNEVKVAGIPQEKSVVESIKEEAVKVVYANSTPLDMTRVFSVNPNKVVLTVTGRPKKEVLGFFPYWLMTNWNDVNLGALTSIALFGLETDGAGDIITRHADGEIDPGWDMWQNPNLPSLIRKARENNLKIYLTVKSFNNDNIESLSKNDAAQQKFVANVSYLVSSRNLDGVNIDFEPTRGMDAETRAGFTRLIKNLSTELRKQNPNAHVSIDTYLSSGSEQGLFDLPRLADDIDAFVIMGYDMHTLRGDPGPLAAMGGQANVIGYVQNYLEKIPPSKIILAVPYYGYDWAVNKNAEGKALPYAILSENLKTNTLSWDENSQTPYYSYSEGGAERIVHFDNVRSLGIKYDFINDKNLKGVGIWALGYDGNNTDLQKLLIDKFIN
jgi:spore germination protein YaaH